ncbi:MAG: hypothetical protein PVI23_11595 [Maricaulaceae bacterium]|jgi:hypothetical protein
MMNAFARAATAVVAAAALSGCIVVTSDDDEREVGGWFDNDEVFLIASYDAIESGDNHAFFYHVALPTLSMEHPATNAGNAEYPWYCFAFDDAVEADYARRRIAAMDGGRALAEQLYIEETCAAG